MAPKKTECGPGSAKQQHKNNGIGVMKEIDIRQAAQVWRQYKSIACVRHQFVQLRRMRQRYMLVQ